MERQFCINWAAIVEEAKQRRKQQQLTQSKLAELAGVSTPTISRFENGEKDIQLSTIISVLTVLGMHDQRNLIFSETNERYDSGKEIVIFDGSDGNKKIRCGISLEALEDHFTGDRHNPLRIFRTNQQQIEHEARRKYLNGHAESDGLVLIRTEDLS